ncbi:MAG: adenylyltransferase/cytidyltransferase family protein [Candidatus Acidiferrales bacterium]
MQHDGGADGSDARGRIEDGDGRVAASAVEEDVVVREFSAPDPMGPEQQKKRAEKRECGPPARHRVWSAELTDSLHLTLAGRFVALGAHVIESTLRLFLSEGLREGSRNGRLGQVVSQGELILRRSEWKRNGRGVVCASGSFDLLHPGHVRLLEQARSLGDSLTVAVRSDSGVRELLGDAAKPPRPVTPAAERMEIIAALAAVDFVVPFEAISPRDFLLQFVPDVFVEGGTGIKRESGIRPGELETLGCRVVHVPLEPGYSTAQLIERIAHLPT